MGAIDTTTGIYIYDETDSQPTFSGLLNLAQNNTKSAVAALQALIAGQAATSRNYAYNSNANIAQRGTSFTATGFTFDRWHATITNTTVSRVAIAETDTLFHNAFAFTHTATNATNSAVMRQGFTSDDVALMRGENFTLSMPVRSSNATNTVTIAIERAATADLMISGTWTTINSVTVTPGTTGTIASVTAAIPQNTTARSIRISVTTTNITNGSSVTYGDIMFERGTARSFYRLRNLTASAELRECQTFFNRLNVYASGAVGGGGTGTAAVVTVQFNPTMRATPTSAWVSGGTASDGTVDKTINSDGGAIGMSASGALYIYFLSSAFTATGRGVTVRAALTDFSAELT